MFYEVTLPITGHSHKQIHETLKPICTHLYTAQIQFNMMTINPLIGQMLLLFTLQSRHVVLNFVPAPQMFWI